VLRINSGHHALKALPVGLQIRGYPLGGMIALAVLRSPAARQPVDARGIGSAVRRSA
jgi:hypothetical protein